MTKYSYEDVKPLCRIPEIFNWYNKPIGLILKKIDENGRNYQIFRTRYFSNILERKMNDAICKE